MSRNQIPFDEFLLNPFHQFDKDWFVLTSGEYKTGKFNSMTISWGSFGFMWRRPIAHVVVRPSRYTYQFMESYDSFTLCSFPELFRDALNILGTESGREGDKIIRSGLTPIASQVAAAPGFAEAQLIIECRKIYWADIDPQHFLAENIMEHYPEENFHRSYIGEILNISEDGKHDFNK